jgi:HD superfamily phosphohydrolase YqeK
MELSLINEENDILINENKSFLLKEPNLEININEDNISFLTELNFIRDKIECMNKFNQIEVLRILHKHNEVTLNENKYGIHINLSDLSKTILEELHNYIKYVNTQEIVLHEVEQEKENFKNIYFTKDNKDIKTKNSI